MTEIAECTACQLIITKNPLIPLQRTLSLLSPPLLAGVVFTFHACWNSPPYGSEMHRYVVRARARTLARAHALPVTKTGHGSGPHRRRLDKLVCLSVSTHASVNTYGVDGRKEGRGIGSGGQFCSQG